MALLFAAGMLLATGCGADEGGDARPTAKSKKFHERAVKFNRGGQRLCRRLGRDAASFLRAVRLGNSASGLRRMLDRTERFYRRLERLNPPERTMRSKIRRVISLGRRDDRDWYGVLANVEQGVPLPTAIAPIRRASARRGRKADRLFRQLGLTECTGTELQDAARAGL